MPASFLVVPEWQGSVSTRAMNGVAGAEAILGDLPSSATQVVEVPVEAGDSLGTGVKRYSTLLRIRERMRGALRDRTGLTVTVGGDCGASLAAVEHAMARTDGDLAVVWLDAHPDLHTPDSSPSGAFNGMVLRAILGDGPEGLRLDGAARVPVHRVVLGGVRAPDPAEERFIAHHQVVSLPVTGLAGPTELIEAVRATGAGSVFVHIDLDVLDPAAIAGLGYPLPFGIAPDTLAATLRGLVAAVPLGGAAIAGFSPASVATAVDDLPIILRLIGALTSAS
jgi:arginase